MNFSDVKLSIYTYLGYKGIAADAQTDEEIGQCLGELEGVIRFSYTFKQLDVLPEFLSKQPYCDFLKGCKSIVLCATTLGVEVDRRIKYLSKIDMRKSLIFDACASAALEWLADEYEGKFGEERTYRFCPGYGGSDIKDLQYIFTFLRPEKIGISLTDSGLMLPQKSMAGIIGIGKKMQKTCAECINFSACAYLKDGKKCYSSVKK